jgi:hypothetical protein
VAVSVAVNNGSGSGISGSCTMAVAVVHNGSEQQ